MAPGTTSLDGSSPTVICRVEDSVVAFHSCTVEAQDGSFCTADRGGFGLSAEESSILLESTVVIGGNGGILDEEFCPSSSQNECGDGGDAIFAWNSDLVLLQTTLTRGLGGSIWTFSGCDGNDGERVRVLGSSTLLDDPSTAPGLRASDALVIEGKPVQLTIDGQSGELVYLLAYTASPCSYPRAHSNQLRSNVSMVT